MAIIFDQRGQPISGTNPLPVYDAGRTASASPLYEYHSVAVANGVGTLTLAVASPPAGTRWRVATIVITTPADTTVSAVRLDNHPTGVFVGPSTYHEQRVKEIFGDYLTVTDEVEIDANNEGGDPANVVVVLYGWAESE